MDDHDREQQAELARGVREELQRHGVVGLATTWVDNSGITRVKAVPLARLEHAAAWGIGASPVFDGFLADDSIVAGRFAGSPVGDLRLHPDLSRVVPLAALPGWAWSPAVRYRQDGAVHPQDQRSVAMRAVDQLRQAGYTARMAFEIEWALSTSAPDFVPAAHGPAYGFTRLAERSDYLRELLVALEAQGVAVDQIHPEYAPGQYELSVAAEDPVAAADTLVLVRETIRALSLRCGLHASFSPKVDASGVGNGGHVHVSLSGEDGNIFRGGSGRYGLTEPAESFTAGILERVPALLAVGAPSAASYLRLIPSHWAGAFQVWGLENREAALRIVTGSSGATDAANLEVKVFDLSANPYLTVAAVLFAGLAGMTQGTKLPEPVDVDPASIAEDERAARGIRPLPQTLAESAAAFEADDALTTGLGVELATTLVELRQAEAARFADSSAEQIAAAARWKY
ncbi:MAG TPA: glutamine synthetase family protein [Jatrophihabitans sp.]|nr:glutamine synthetase family protein [Jatrophihabitans sp.]